MLCAARVIVIVIVTAMVLASVIAIVHVVNRLARVLVECLFAEGQVVGNGLAG